MSLPTGQDIIYWAGGAALLSMVIGAILAGIITMIQRNGGGVDLGKIKIRGQSAQAFIGNVVKLELLKIEAGRETKQEQRDVVREATRHMENKLRQHSHEAINLVLIGCHSDPEEVRDFRVLAENAGSRAMRMMMESVERNHFAEKTDIEWHGIKSDQFTKIWSELDQYFMENFHSPNMVFKGTIGLHLSLKSMEYRDIFDRAMDRCRQLAVSLVRRREAIDGELQAYINPEVGEPI